MPSWQPNWSDVRFDHKAAQAVVVECHAAARVIDASLHTEACERCNATADWTGKAREEFDFQSQWLWRIREQLRDELRTLAGAVVAAGAQAHAEQARREAGRQRWREEHAAEERRRTLR